MASNRPSVRLWNGQRLEASNDVHKYHLTPATLWDFNTPTAVRTNTHGFPNFTLRTGAMGVRNMPTQCMLLTDGMSGGGNQLSVVHVETTDTVVQTDPDARLVAAHRQIEIMKNEIHEHVVSAAQKEEQFTRQLREKDEMAQKIIN